MNLLATRRVEPAAGLETSSRSSRAGSCARCCRAARPSSDSTSSASFLKVRFISAHQSSIGLSSGLYVGHRLPTATRRLPTTDSPRGDQACSLRIPVLQNDSSRNTNFFARTLATSAANASRRTWFSGESRSIATKRFFLPAKHAADRRSTDTEQRRDLFVAEPALVEPPMIDSRSSIGVVIPTVDHCSRITSSGPRDTEFPTRARFRRFA